MTFDFISDEKFRTSLESDFREMTACKSAQSWKAVYVLAGSIIEALLIEYLVMSNIRPNGKDPLKIDLATAIEACTSDGVLRADTSSLCEVVREYRNLIHPGRVIRLNQELSQEGAIIATNLVSLIAKEVATRRKINYGLTAEQILNKLKSDQHTIALLPELLSETKEIERFKLVSSLIPDAYTSEESFVPNDTVLYRLRVGYRQALETLPVEKQTQMAVRFANLVRSESAERIQSFGDAFFSAKDIAHLEPKDASVVTKHLLTRLADSSTTISLNFVQSLTGIGEFIAKGGGSEFADALISLTVRHTDEDVKVSDFVFKEYDNVLHHNDKKSMEKQIASWIKFGKEKGYSQKIMKRLEAISNMWIEIPF